MELLERYIPYFQETVDLFEGSFSVEKPSPESGYTITRGFGRIGDSKQLVKGYIKTKVNKQKKSKTGRSRQSFKKAAKKAARTRRSDKSGQAKAARKRKKTLQQKKRSGL
jgi:hypothetical protein